MNKLREKLLDFKKRLSGGKMYSITIVVIGIVAAFGIYQYRKVTNFQQELDSNYNRAFFDLIGYVQNVETLMMKSRVSATPLRVSSTLKEAWQQSNLAQVNLSQLPISQPVLANTSKFLTQVSDFSYALSNQTLSGKLPTEEQEKSLDNMHKYATNLKNSLNDLQAEIASGRIKWGSLESKGTTLFSHAASQGTPMEQIESIDKGLKEYPSLIYDGPFSDHLTGVKPKGLTGSDVSDDDAKNRVFDFIGRDKVAEVNMEGQDITDTIKIINFSVKLKNAPEEASYNISITRTGGHPLWMLWNRPYDQPTLNMDGAKKAAKDFLNSRGYKEMKDTYYTVEGNLATINFAAVQENVIIYPDLIKVKVALDNGDIVGFESKGYYYSHYKRDIPAPKLSIEEARKKINPKMQINSSGLAIIPTEFKTEVFTYEFKGRLNDREFIVYVNAETGWEENILLLMENQNGILTM